MRHCVKLRRAYFMEPILWMTRLPNYVSRIGAQFFMVSYACLGQDTKNWIRVECHYIARGKPTQNAFIESFNWRLPEEPRTKRF